MPTLEQIANTLRDVPLLNRIAGACVKLARTVLMEAPSTPQHAIRLRWARKVMLNPFQMAERMRTMVLMHTAVATEIPTVSDASIETAVEAALPKLADTDLPEARDVVEQDVVERVLEGGPQA